MVLVFWYFAKGSRKGRAVALGDVTHALEGRRRKGCMARRGCPGPLHFPLTSTTKRMTSSPRGLVSSSAHSRSRSRCRLYVCSHVLLSSKPRITAFLASTLMGETSRSGWRTSGVVLQAASNETRSASAGRCIDTSWKGPRRMHRPGRRMPHIHVSSPDQVMRRERVAMNASK